MKIKKYRFFVEGISGTDINLAKVERCKNLTENEFLEILKDKCTNFSFQNDLLWRSKVKKSDFQLFEPNYRNAKPSISKFF